ncbi:hypothetical protein ACFQ2M_14385 [Kitasatospora saccharophila]|uniref:hypothetical protein n=1 Tax=Kitasatospora saccharophila TaxID=407973 RepID=UPI0036343B53
MSGITIKVGPAELTVPDTPAGYVIAGLAVIGPVVARIIVTVVKRRRNNEIPPGTGSSDGPTPVEPDTPDGPTPVESDGPDGPAPADSRPRCRCVAGVAAAPG